MSLNYQ